MDRFHFFLSFIKLMHFLIVIFVLIGWSLPWPVAWALHGLLIPLMVLQWRFNEDTCFLTNIENKLRGDAKPKSEQQGQFIKMLLYWFCRPIPSDDQIEKGLYALLAAVWLFSCGRFLYFWIS